MHPTTLIHDLLATGPCVRGPASYQWVEVAGPDAGEFLQRLCTQDVRGLPDRAVRPAAFLDAKGKLVATCLVARLATDFWLEVASEQATRLLASLERYHFTEKLVLRAHATQCREEITAGTSTPAAVRTANGIELVVARRGVTFRRVHTFAGGGDGAVDRDAAARAECLRLCAGFLRVGVETEPTTLALEADLDDHVSTTKGCYTGQEIVARIHTYGHVNRKACLLLLGPGAPFAAAQPLHETEDRLAVGRVLHAVAIPGRDARLGVGYLPKDFQALGTRLALADGTAAEVIGYEPLALLPA